MAADASAFSSSSRSSFSVSDDADEYSVSDALASSQSSATRRLGVRVARSAPRRRRDSISITDDSGGSAKRTFRCRAELGTPTLVLLLVGRL